MQENGHALRHTMPRGDDVALIDGPSGRTMSYGKLHELVGGVATRLVKHWRIAPGERVALVARGTADGIILFLACQEIGAILVPLQTRFTAHELASHLRDAKPALIVGDDTYPSSIDGWLDSPVIALDRLVEGAESEAFDDQPKVRGDSEWPCLLLYTSGSTGQPKGALLSTRMILANAEVTRAELGLTERDTAVNFLPFCHTGGWNVVCLPMLLSGGAVVQWPRFEPERVLELCEAGRISILFGVPTTLATLARSPAFAERRLGAVRLIITGGETMPRATLEKWLAHGVRVRLGYGLTEFGPNALGVDARDTGDIPAVLGRPYPGVEVKLVRDGMPRLGPDEGELWLKGSQAMTGYWRGPEQPPSSKVGSWIATGDIVKRWPNGLYSLIGRSKDIFISGGENVSVCEVEQVLMAFPTISEAVVIGVADPVWGEVGMAFVVASDGEPPDWTELTAHCQRFLARYKVPKHWRSLAKLPRGPSGKIRRLELRDLIGGP